VLVIVRLGEFSYADYSSSNCDNLYFSWKNSVSDVNISEEIDLKM
jgi:hypothetical protein